MNLLEIIHQEFSGNYDVCKHKYIGISDIIVIWNHNGEYKAQIIYDSLHDKDITIDLRHCIISSTYFRDQFVFKDERRFIIEDPELFNKMKNYIDEWVINGKIQDVK